MLLENNYSRMIKLVFASTCLALGFWSCNKPVLFNELQDSFWSQQTTTTKADLTGVAFANDDLGWAIGDSGVVLQTTDGGTTWSLIESGTQERLTSISLIGNTESAWIVGSKGFSEKINRSSLGRLNSFPNTKGFSHVQFINDTLGFISGSNEIYADGFTPGPILYKTINGGLSWKGTAFSNLYPDRIRPLAHVFFSGANGIAANDSATFYFSTDYGETWTDTFRLSNVNQHVIGLTQNSESSFSIITNEAIYRYDFANRTQNLYSSFYACNETSNTFPSLRASFFLDRDNGWLISSNALFSTQVGGDGSAWCKTQVSKDNVLLNGIFFTNSGTGWTVGNQGVILKKL